MPNQLIEQQAKKTRAMTLRDVAVTLLVITNRLLKMLQVTHDNKAVPDEPAWAS